MLQHAQVGSNRGFPVRRPGVLRLLLVGSAAAVLAPPWAHALAAVLDRFAPTAAAAWAWPLTICALLVSVAAVASAHARAGLALAAGAGALGCLTLVAWCPSAVLPSLALIPVALGSAVLARVLEAKLPAGVEVIARVRRRRAVLWAVAALIAVVQVARLSTWMSDPASDWFLTTRHPFWTKHDCLNAYLHGAELALRGEDNIYDAQHYPGLNPEAKPRTEVAGMVVEDPYQYAPQFLLWPAAALALTHDFSIVQALWFALQVTGFLCFAAFLAAWVGGRAGRAALWMLPLALTAFPALHNLQYGQFHLAAVALATAGMLAFETGRNRLGGALMAIAALSKLFPGLLLLLLIAQRRWRAVAWTAGFGAALTGATLALFGTAPLRAFFDYHLPRLQSGAAFAFGEAWPEFSELLLVGNHGVYGFVVKLAELGVPGLDQTVAAWVNRAYAVLLAALALWIGRRARHFDREQHAVVWLALLGLGSMMSTGAIVDYVPATATWLFTLVAYRMTRPAVAVGLGVAWASQYTLAFTTPIFAWFEPGVMIPLSAVSALLMLGAQLWTLRVVLRAGATAPVSAEAASWRAPVRTASTAG